MAIVKKNRDLLFRIHFRNQMHSDMVFKANDRLDLNFIDPCCLKRVSFMKIVGDLSVNDTVKVQELMSLIPGIEKGEDGKPALFTLDKKLELKTLKLTHLHCTHDT